VSDPVQLNDDTIAVIAEAAAQATIAALQRCGLVRTPRRLLDVDDVAAILGTHASWVYEHKADIGFVILGEPPRHRLRFDEQHVRDYIRRSESGPSVRRDITATTAPTTRARRRTPASAGLIPFDED
jgi:predicted DNA-binding transcriptional regulator AlpA